MRVVYKLFAMLHLAALQASAFVPARRPAFSLAPLRSSTADVGGRTTGTVKWFDDVKGFGFISMDGGGADMFVHASGVSFDGPVEEDDKVSFLIERDQRSGKLKAVSVERAAAFDQPRAMDVTEDFEEATAGPIAADVDARDVEGAAEATAIRAEAFQRARLEEQLQIQRSAREAAEAAVAEAEAAEEAAAAVLRAEEEAAREIAAKKAAEEEAAAEKKRLEEEAAEKKRLEEEAARIVAQKAAEEAAAEEKRLEEEAAAAETKRLEEQAALEAEQEAAAEKKRLEEEAEKKRLEEEAAIKAEQEAAAEKKRLEEEAALKAEQEAAAEKKRLEEEAEKKRLEEEAALKAEQEAAAEKKRLEEEAEKKRLEEEAAALQAAEEAARELGYPSLAAMEARRQPKPAEEEAALAAKYGALPLEERAFTILYDLGMVTLHEDPDDPNRDTSRDDEDIE